MGEQFVPFDKKMENIDASIARIMRELDAFLALEEEPEEPEES